MDNFFLTDLEHAGGSGVLPLSATREDRMNLELHLYALKAAGHAIICDEVRESGETTGEIRIQHYLSCVACKRTVL